MITVEELQRLKYVSTDIEFSFWIKFCNKIIALRGRKAVFKRFCIENGIDLPLVPGRKYVTPKEYEIRHDRIGYLGSIRDKAIFAYYSPYMKNKLVLDDRIMKKKEDIANRESFIKHKKEILADVSRSLKSEKDPSAFIAYQAQEALLKTEIENQSKVLEEYKNDLSLLLGVGAENVDSWGQQVRNIESSTKALTSSFVRDLGRMITEKLDFIDFTYEVLDYSEKVEQIMKGIKNATAKN